MNLIGLPSLLLHTKSKGHRSGKEDFYGILPKLAILAMLPGQFAFFVPSLYGFKCDCPSGFRGDGNVDGLRTSESLVNYMH